MSESKRRFFVGDRVEQAVLAAARHFGIRPEEIAYRQIEKRHGFVRAAKRAIIEVDESEPRRAASAPLPKVAPAVAPAPAPRAAAPAGRPPMPSGPRPERSRHDGERVRARPPRREEPARASVGAAGGLAPMRWDDDPAPAGAERVRRVVEGSLVEQAERALERLITLSGLALTARSSWEGRELRVELEGRDQGRLLEEEGELLQAIEVLLPRMLHGEGSEAVVCRADSGGFRSAREGAMQRLASETAEAVRRTGRPVALEPMPPGDRRLIHVALADAPGIVTESEGEGAFRRLVVKPSA